MFCHKCGSEVLDNSQFCHSCGKTLTHSPTQQKNNLTNFQSKETTLNINSFKSIEEALCIHCGYKGVHGIDDKISKEAKKVAFFIAGVGGLVLVIFMDANKVYINLHGTQLFFGLGLVLSLVVRFIYTEGKIDVFNCPNCKNIFYRNKKGLFSKTDSW